MGYSPLTTGQEQAKETHMSAKAQGPHHPGAEKDASPTSPVETEQAQPSPRKKLQARLPLRIYSHSSLFFWWPVWVIGYVMTFITWVHGKPQQLEALGQAKEWVHQSSNLGVVFFLVLFLVILITNLSVRGMASGLVILGAMLITVVLAYAGWWDTVFSWIGNLKIHLSMGAYFWFSTLVFLTWAVTVFWLDRVSYWEVTPGQVTYKSLLGADSKTYNAQGMGLEKHRDDLFRHWLLGIGSGDLRIRTSGATLEQIEVPNVLFVGSKVRDMQRLISEVPDEREAR